MVVMVPKASEDEPGEDTREAGRKAAVQNPAVLRAAVQFVKKKKQEAIEKEEYEQAAVLHARLQSFEEKLREVDAGGGGIGEDDIDEAGSAGDGDVGKAAPAPRKRSLFAAPNPFRTVQLLRQSGYSRVQAILLLVLLYVVVFGIEVLLLYVGWSFWGQGAMSGEEGVEEVFDEF